ncbi:MAG TPA: hypothetical protein PLV88_01885 [Methanoregulaceae archaeon]|nr:hypothetical protein [Methanoregulaceae archaeon]HNI41185.1 hypothetical protein [Methanoregulaceae archaeon]
MNDLVKDLQAALTPDITVVKCDDFEDQNDLIRFMKEHPAEIFIVVQAVQGPGLPVRWKGGPAVWRDDHEPFYDPCSISGGK